MNSEQPTETKPEAVDASELPPPVPPLPPRPQAAPAQTVPVVPQPPREMKDPAWWRLGSAPMLALLFAAAVGDLCWPSFFAGWGVGAGIGCALLIAAVLVLRKDFSRGEKAFLIGLAAITFVALIVSGSGFNWLMALVLPLLLCLVPTRTGSTAEPGPYRNWWSYWVARRKRIDKSRWSWLRQVLPTLITILVAVVLFILFLCIFASGNPVVELVWNTIADWWNELVEYLDLDWDFVNHVLLWLFGIVAFGLYTLPRSKAAPAVPPAPVKVKEGSSILPQLPLASLIGINLAFLVATSTDIAYLWFGAVPEGISQTAYLHEGAASISWAAGLASLILVILFRRNGTARRSLATRIAGYTLVAQTFLLAVSVYLRLYHQIDDMGFTTRRIQAAEAMLLGLDGLVILVCYMACSGSFWKYTRICLGSMLLLFVAFGICPPSELAANLNMHYIKQGKGKDWNFAISDFRNGRFVVGNNLEFAKHVYDHHVPTTSEPADMSLLRDSSYISPDYSAEWFRSRLEAAARKVELREQEDTWTNWNWSLSRDIPVARAILHPEQETPPAPAAQERSVEQPAPAAAATDGTTSSAACPAAPAPAEAAPQPAQPAAAAAAAAPAAAAAASVVRKAATRKPAAKRVTKANTRRSAKGSSKRVAKSSKSSKSTKARKSSRKASSTKRVARNSKSRKTTRSTRRASQHRQAEPQYPYYYGQPYMMGQPVYGYGYPAGYYTW